MLDIGIADGTIVDVGAGLDARGAQVFDAGDRLVFPGVVDAHQHWGIYNPLEIDAGTESRAAAQGGVTTGITYIRTG
ncbi:MAG: hydantoinase, partial [Actinobacteria bacterium]|nr:hydantoinase [Actinomycetota bacterium]NIU69899.1 hydantoinase [Actinomycetota bacterium]NIW31777.1 hydantoinase [Actinomycetota bacterium]